MLRTADNLAPPQTPTAHRSATHLKTYATPGKHNTTKIFKELTERTIFLKSIEEITVTKITDSTNAKANTST